MASKANRGRRLARVAVDIAMAATLIAVMSCALVQEKPHEYLGIAAFTAVVAHNVLNRHWFKALFRGRYNVVRTLQVAMIVGLVACIVGLMASSLVLSKHAFGFLPAIPGASWARRVHMLCSYWGFVFAFAHAGLHLKGLGVLMRSKASVPSVAVWLGRIVAAVLSCYGIYAFVRMNLGAYLLGQVQFAFVDYSAPISLSLARHAAVAVLVTAVFHCLRLFISRFATGRASQ